MSIEKRANRVLEQAKALALRVESWADFYAGLNDSKVGIIPTTFPGDMERQAFFDSPQYVEIKKMRVKLIKRFGVVKGKNLTEKSGKFVVRIPKSVHQSLDVEAKLEGVSLNQLAMTKLSLPLPRATDATRRGIIEAFNSTHDGYSQDWVIVEPVHNEAFLNRCRALGLTESDYRLNHLLMNIRKTSKYKGCLNPTIKESGYQSYDDCFYAAEIAIRTLQRTEGVSLDHVLCDPEIRGRFDNIATQLCGGQTSLKLRCAALNLRKTHRLKPMEMVPEKYKLVSHSSVKSVNLTKIAEIPGTYAFYDHNRPIFAGETDNLRKRLGLHLNGGLPEWLGPKDDDGFVVKYSEMPSATRKDRQLWLSSFIVREHPLLNYQEAA